MMLASALPIIGIACCNDSMLSGPELGHAIADAISKMGVTQQHVADAFGVTQPSVAGWIKTGRMHKKHIPALMSYFARVCGPDHWGLPFSKDEFDLVLAFRCLPAPIADQLLDRVKAAASEYSEANRRATDALTGQWGELGGASPDRPHRTPTHQKAA